MPDFEVDVSRLLTAAAPSGFESAHQEWEMALDDVADHIGEDVYGNRIAVAGDVDACVGIAFAAHADQNRSHRPLDRRERIHLPGRHRPRRSDWHPQVSVYRFTPAARQGPQ